MDINLTSQIFVYTDLASFPTTGAAKTFYVADDTEKLYRWTGSAYVEVSAGSGGSSTWGGITGTLSDQTDLQTALNNKEPLKGSDDNYVTDAQLVVISNTSGTNTGDNATNTTSNSYADGKVANDLTASTTVAPSKTAVNTALALKADTSSINNFIRFYSSVVANVDSTIYYFPFFQAALGTSIVGRVFSAQNASTLTKVQLYRFQTGNGSSENITLYIRNITTSTDYLIGTFTEDTGANTSKWLTFSGLSIAINNTDVYALKMLTPAWTSNPTGCYYDGTLIFA